MPRFTIIMLGVILSVACSGQTQTAPSTDSEPVESALVLDYLASMPSQMPQGTIYVDLRFYPGEDEQMVFDRLTLGLVPVSGVQLDACTYVLYNFTNLYHLTVCGG